MKGSSRLTADRMVLIGLLLAAAVYCQDLRYAFVGDDVPLILMNQRIDSWRNWKTLFTTHIFAGLGEPTQRMIPHYRPVYMLWLMLNQHLFGAVVPWWHLTSLLLHLGVTLLVFQLGLKLLKDPWTAALAALLFAFHPIHVETVSYVSASTDLLVALMALISFLLYARFREEGASPIYFGASLLAATLAMLSKETGAMIPWLLVAYEAVRENPRGAIRDWKRFAWTLPYFVVVGAYTVVRTLLFGQSLVNNHFTVFRDAPIVVIAYLRNLLWPNRLSFYYPVDWVSHWTLLRAVAVVAVLAASAWLWIHFRERPGLRLQLLWFPILLAPPLLGMLVFEREDWVHDRHMYLASIPICLIAAALLRDLKLPKNIPVTASAVIVAILCLETAVQVPRFRNDLSIYQSALQVAPRNVLVHRFYAGSLWAYADQKQALQQFRIAIQLSPRWPVLYQEYGGVLTQLGRDGEAEAQYTKALELTPSPTPYRAWLLYSLAKIELKDSEPAQAAGHMREALRIAPKSRDYQAALAEALRQQ